MSAPAQPEQPAACRRGRSTGPLCEDGVHGLRCLFGHDHVWEVWYEQGHLVRTADTLYCYRCRSMCTAGEPVPEQPLRQRIAEALAATDVHWGYHCGFSAAPDDDMTAAYVTAVLAAVQPDLDARDAEIQQLRAELAAYGDLFDTAGRVLATSALDWSERSATAWLWGVINGWDCNRRTHDDTCVHGAMEEQAAKHRWDAETVATIRRFHAAITYQPPATTPRPTT